MEEEIIENPSSLCRICFEIGCYEIDSHQLIVDSESIAIKVVLSKFSAIEVSYSEGIPSMLCSSCANQLAQCYLFLKRIQNSDEQMKLFLSYIHGEGEEEEVSDNQSELSYPATDEVENEEQKSNHESCDAPDEITEDAEDSIPSNYLFQEELEENPRKRNANKNPVFVLTENVTNILSNAQKSCDFTETASSANYQPAAKIKKENTEASSFMVTKFVLTEPQSVQNFQQNEIHREAVDGESSSTNFSQVRMFDVAAVEVNAGEKINVDLEDESNFENPNTMYMCKYCPRAFSTSHHLIMHARKSHVCQFCMKGFKKIADLHKHTKEMHNQFNCTLCKKDFSSNSNLRQHMKRVHSVELPAHVSLLSFKVNEALTNKF